MQRLNLYTGQGGVTVVTTGIASTTKVLGIFPGATVSVFNQGTVVLASIFGDNGITPKSNPFVSDSTTGLAFFYSANGRYDIQLSGTGFSTFTLADIELTDISDPTVIASLTVTGNAAIGGTLGITGATTLASLAVTGSETVGGTLVVTGAATAATVNKVTITQPATGSTLTIVDGKTAKIDNTLELAGPDGSIQTFQATGTIVSRTSTDTLTNKTIDTAGVNTLKVNGNTLAATAGAATITIPNATDTLVGKATTDTLTNKTLTSAVANGTLNGSAIHSQRFTALSVSAAGATQGQQFTTTQTISQNMGDTNFRVVASISGASAGSPFVLGAVPASATSVTVTMANGSAVQSTVTALDIICVHD